MCWNGVDICGVYEHRFTDSLEPNEVLTLMGKDCKFKLFCAQAGILLIGNWADNVINVHRISDRIILLKLIIMKAFFTFLLAYIPQVGLPEHANDDQVQYNVAKLPATELFIPVGDWNGHAVSPAGSAVHMVCFSTCDTEEFWSVL